jgi:nucleolar pre-ribosomal-associated protein 1
MLKRPHQQDDGRPPKRLKPTTAPPKPPPSEQIHFARQLQTLLTFDQTNIPHLRTGIASFKAFLESILYHKDEDDRGRQLSILREYLENEKPNDLDDKDTPFLSQLWQAWSFASHSHSDQVVSSVSALFALIVKTLASLLDFRDYGLLLCRTVLQHQHLRLVKRSLEAPRHKDYVVSPVLRLLVEVAGFDGGVCARRVWEGREMCFESAVLRRLLGWTRSG